MISQCEKGETDETDKTNKTRDTRSAVCARGWLNFVSPRSDLNFISVRSRGFPLEDPPFVLASTFPLRNPLKTPPKPLKTENASNSLIKLEKFGQDLIGL